MSKHILITEVDGKRYSTILYNVLRISSDNVRHTINFTDGQEDRFVPNSEFIIFGEVHK